VRAVEGEAMIRRPTQKMKCLWMLFMWALIAKLGPRPFELLEPLSSIRWYKYQTRWFKI
jgi:hypothetical protein